MKSLRATRAVAVYLAITMIALALGYFAFNFFIGVPKVGIVKVTNVALDQTTVQKVLSLLKYASEQKNIRAIVLELDCPGGGAMESEEVYLNLLQLRKKKPVVASIDKVALSGGYYVAAASDFIYAKPTSLVGSIGVWMRLPGPEELEEDVMASGPAKSTGGVRKKATAWLQTVAEGFLQAVIAQRGGNLKLSKEELSQAEVYLGVEALRLGLIDKIGTTSEAVEKAAALAGLRNYREVDINQELKLLLPREGFFFSELSSKAGNSDLTRGIYPQYYYLDIRARE